MNSIANTASNKLAQSLPQKICLWTKENYLS
uniref:Uncharacterized protein n=1 Tax=Setaria italica TaxID=4555 RepID=K3Y4H6_SETIT